MDPLKSMAAPPLPGPRRFKMALRRFLWLGFPPDFFLPIDRCPLYTSTKSESIIWNIRPDTGDPSYRIDSNGLHAHDFQTHINCLWFIRNATQFTAWMDHHPVHISTEFQGINLNIWPDRRHQTERPIGADGMTFSFSLQLIFSLLSRHSNGNENDNKDQPRCFEFHPPPSVFILYNKPEKYQNMDRDGGMSNTIATTRQFPSVISRSKLIKTRHWCIS